MLTGQAQIDASGEAGGGILMAATIKARPQRSRTALRLRRSGRRPETDACSEGRWRQGDRGRMERPTVGSIARLAAVGAAMAVRRSGKGGKVVSLGRVRHAGGIGSARHAVLDPTSITIVTGNGLKAMVRSDGLPAVRRDAGAQNIGADSPSPPPQGCQTNSDVTKGMRPTASP